MNRRSFVKALASVALLPSLAWARGAPETDLVLDVGASISNRKHYATFRESILFVDWSTEWWSASEIE